MTRRLLLLGEYDSGKTHFGGQLLGRLIKETGALKMIGAAPTLGPYEAALARMNSGRAASHTPQDHYVESRWPLANETGERIELQWPDYGGEQLRAFRTERAMPPEWRERIRGSDAWIVLVRIAHHQLSDDIFTRPLTEPGKERQVATSFTVSTQAQLVDFLQWLMFVRRTGTLVPIDKPPLMLLLSCWDELPHAEASKPPMEVLEARMPMVAAFAEANWQVGALEVMGLSALERPLFEDKVDEEYVDRGPEAFGYVVLPDGQRNSDLTLAIDAMV
jgi:hypothetical protein